MNVSTLGLEGPQMGKLVGWLMDKIEGEEKESAWSVDLGVTMGELTYQDHGLRRVVVLWRDGVTALRAERLGVNFGIGWGLFSADNITARIEGGVARIDEIVLVGRAAAILASGVEVGWSDGVRFGARSVSCTVIVDQALEIFSSELVRGNGGGEGVAHAGEPLSSDGDALAPGVATRWSMEVGMVVVGLQTSDKIVTIWSSGMQFDAGRFGVGCAGMDVDCERLVRTGAIEAVDGDQRRITLGNVNIWLRKEYFGAINRCWELWNTVNSRSEGAQAVVLDPGHGSVGGADGAGEAGGRTNVRIATAVVELGSLTVRLGEREGAEVTIVDTRTGERTTAVEGDDLLESIALEDGYSLYEDHDVQGIWYISRPVSFRSLLKMAAKIDGVEVTRNEEVQLYVGPGGGRLCELEIEGEKLILGVPGWGGAEGWEDWKVDVLAPRPGSTIHVDLGDFSCVLSSTLSTYNRLDLLLAPKVLLRNELACECTIEISGEQSGAIVMEAGMEIGVDVSPDSMFVVVIRNSDAEYRTLPLSFERLGSQIMTMRPMSDLVDRPSAIDTMKVELVINHIFGYAQTRIRPCRETGDYRVRDVIGRRITTDTEPAVNTSTASRTGTEDRHCHPIGNEGIPHKVNGRSSDTHGADSDRRLEEGHVKAQTDKAAQSNDSHCDKIIGRMHSGGIGSIARDPEEKGTTGRSRWSPGFLADSGNDAVGLDSSQSPYFAPCSGHRSIDTDRSGQAVFGATSNPSKSKSACSRLEDFFREHDRFNADIVFERLSLAWDSDLSDARILTKFANLQVHSGPQKSIFTVESACSIEYAVRHFNFGRWLSNLALITVTGFTMFGA